MKENSIKKLIKEIFHYLYEKGLITAADGNISYKISEKKLIINKSNVFKGKIKEKDLIVVKLNKKFPLTASKELKLHINLYQINPQIKAIIHSHPLYPLIIKKPNKDFLKGTGLKEKEISFLSYYPPGSEELANKIKKVGKDKKLIILKSHGIVVLGKDLKEAFFLTEKINFWAKYQYLQELKKR
uniref:Class II aldolase/adducin family protein n=1 Tax=candidate division WOR-3 bacterium TaxID=2052148 RepID=A0A7V3ZUW3_UNCW3